MIVYAEREEIVSARALLEECIASKDELRFGQLEAGVVDAWCPEFDDASPAIETLRRAAVTREYEAVRALPLPDTIRIRPQEGFAYYALYPDQYARAARRFEAECQPRRCVLIGVRSIGTVLSAVVARTLRCPVWTMTVRPRGHPFDRHVRFSPELERRIREERDAHFLVVDEGPGMSGSSFVSVAEALGERVVLFPSHEPDAANFVSERARALWPQYPKYVEPFRSPVPAGAADLSGGAWRGVVGTDPAVQPMHERRKYLHDGVLWKWAGLGFYGRSKLERARRLHEAGFGPEPLGLVDGFLLTRWVDGRPADRLPEVLDRYVEFVGREFRTGRSTNIDALCEMIRVNAGLELEPPCEETVAVDGRMMPHEWIETAAGWVKTDALDHHDDHFFPGCQPIAWDRAGVEVEFGLIDRACDFWSQAYAAWRIGYCTMAAKALDGTVDGVRFARLRDRYRGLLAGNAVP
jgi:hypothetical protein